MSSALQKDKKGQFMEKLKDRARKDPVVFGFLGLTVAALSGGLFALLKNDKRRSQTMMRFRVLFQLCTVGALVGGIYYRTYREQMFPDDTDKTPLGPVTDNRVFLKNPRVYDAVATVTTNSGTVPDSEQMK